jgi:hypothetical protein
MDWLFKEPTHTYAIRMWTITGDIKMVAEEIGQSLVVMT